MTALRLGLTGGLASGKSTVAGSLRAAGCFVVDADRLVADLYRPGEPGAEAVEALFGRDVLDAAGAVDPPRLAALVFSDLAARQRLEQAIHPLVRQRFETLTGDRDGIVVLEATLLVEAGYGPDFDVVVTIEAEPDVQLARAVERGLTAAQAAARLAAQGDGRRRRLGAHRILWNRGSLDELAGRVDALLAELGRRRTAGAGAAPALPSHWALVTGNPDKLAEARRLCGLDLEAVALDLPEIQSLDLEAVARAKAEEAWQRLRRPLVVEETGFELAALGGFPGPLVKWMLEAVGAEGVARVALDAGDPRATARCLLLCRDELGEVMAEGELSGELLLPARGDGGFGWDPVFRPDGSEQTCGELAPEAKDALSHRGQAWRRLVRKLT